MSTSDDELRKKTMELLQSYLTLYNQHRFDELIEIWAEDGIYEFPYAPEGRPRILQGKKEIYEYMTRTSVRIAVDSVTEMRIHPMLNPEFFAAEISIKGRALTTGRPYNQTSVVFAETKNGRILRIREYWNSLISLEAFGGNAT